MYFPALFSRMTAGAGLGLTVLGTDAKPVGPPNQSTMDNLLLCRFSNTNGWPCHRVAVACKYTGSGVSIAMNSFLYMWEAHTQSWHKVNGTAKAITPNVVGPPAVPGVLAFFDVVALLDMPNAQANMQAAGSGSIALALVVPADPGEGAGRYDFAIGPDLTTFDH